METIKQLPWEQGYTTPPGCDPLRKPIGHLEFNVSWDFNVEGYVTNYGEDNSGERNVHFFNFHSQIPWVNQFESIK